MVTSVKVLLAAGGTGGHITPALATAQELRQLNGEAQVVFVGSESVGDEALWGVPTARVVRVSRAPMPSRLSVGSVRFPFQLCSSTVQSGAILFKEAPDVVVGFGGYASGPLVFLAALRGIPTLIHEQNVVPGRANRWLSRLVDRIAISFPETRQRFGAAAAKTICTGNPIRHHLLETQKASAYQRFDLQSSRLTLLVVGGSQGAQAVNRLVAEAVEKMTPQARRQLQIVHLAGAADTPALQERYASLEIVARVFPFLHEIGDAYAVADLVVARAGASTIAELTCFGLPMVLIPYPYAGGHQRLNAQIVARAGAAVMLEQEGLTGERLAAEIVRLMTDAAGRRRMGEGSRRAGHPDAARRLATEILTLIEQRGRKRSGHDGVVEQGRLAGSERSVSGGAIAS